MNATVSSAMPWQDQALPSTARERGLSRLLIAYVSAGLAFLVLPGTLIGVWNLISISSARSGGAAQAGWVQAHGHAQIFGWVGSFILGIGFYSIPKLRRIAGFPLPTGWLCWMLWTAGVLMRWTTGLWPGNWRFLLPVSAAMELCAFILFFKSISGYHSAEKHKKLENWVLAVLGGTAGWLLTLTLNLLESTRLAFVGASPLFPHAFDQRFLSAATWGFLVPFVWGFSARWMPVFLGLRPQRGSIFLGALALNMVGVISALAGWFLPSAFFMTGATAGCIIALRLWEPSSQPAKTRGIHSSFAVFVRLAYGWLLHPLGYGVLLRANQGFGAPHVTP
jgi:hypothetical protein